MSNHWDHQGGKASTESDSVYVNEFLAESHRQMSKTEFLRIGNPMRTQKRLRKSPNSSLSCSYALGYFGYHQNRKCAPIQRQPAFSFYLARPIHVHCYSHESQGLVRIASDCSVLRASASHGIPGSPAPATGGWMTAMIWVSDNVRSVRFQCF